MVVTGSRLSAEHKAYRLEISVGIILDVKVESDYIEHVKELSLVLVQTLYLNVVHRMCVYKLACLAVKQVGKLYLILMLYRSDAVKNFLIVSKFSEFIELNRIVAVARADSLVKKACKLGV